MNATSTWARVALSLLACGSSACAQPASSSAFAAQLGPRPFFLADHMSDNPLKTKLQACMARTTAYGRSLFSIAHGRGRAGVRRHLHQGQGTGTKAWRLR